MTTPLLLGGGVKVANRASFFKFTLEEILSFEARALNICIHKNWTIIRLFLANGKKITTPLLLGRVKVAEGDNF